MRPLRGAEPSATRRWRVVLLAYCLFVIYGSFVPFDLSTEPAVIQRGIQKSKLWLFDAAGRRRFSILDLVSNVALGVPVGVLLVQGGLVGRALGTRIALAALLELAFASAIETGQLLAPSRTASANDVMAQVTGATMGVLGAQFGGRVLFALLRPEAVRAALRRPATVVALVLGTVLAADALYPYAVTLDVSTAWTNLKHAQLVPMASLERRFWGDLLVETLLAYAALAAAARLALPGRAAWASLAAWTLATALAGGLEVAKLGIVGRIPSVDNVLLGGAGALLGVAAAPVAGHRWVREHVPALTILAAVALLFYEELSPFDFVVAHEMARQRLGRVEWLPLASYSRADTQAALFDLGKKLVLGGFVGVALRSAGWRWPWLATLALGALLESLQLLQMSRVPSMTDVLSLAAGAALGSALLVRYRAR